MPETNETPQEVVLEQAAKTPINMPETNETPQEVVLKEAPKTPINMPDFNKTPQEVIRDFWDKYLTKKPGKVTSVFPRSVYANSFPRGASSARNAVKSYEAAAKECRDKVTRIVEEAHRNNVKFSDPDFDMDLGLTLQNCLKGLIRPEPDEKPCPDSVHRVDWIFDDPKFTQNGYGSSSIKQRHLGDCWWIAAVALIASGYTDEGVEDMTGGVSTTVRCDSILDKEKFWKELINTDGDFVFSTGVNDHAASDGFKGGMPTGHCYSVLKATEEVDEDGNKYRLVLIWNPWGKRDKNGKGEWNGPWSDGSEELTPYWLKKLGHVLKDDGKFWMSYEDMLRMCKGISRTRLFDDKWTVVQQWTSINVGWIAGYHHTKFILEVKKTGTVVVVLSQLDETYFQGLQGLYTFRPHFILRKEGETNYICRARSYVRNYRSVSSEIDLGPGRYEVLPKIAAERGLHRKMVEEVVKEYPDKNPHKLRQIGMQYDLAHAKGGVPDEDDILTKEDERKKKEERKRKKKEEKKRKKKDKEKSLNTRKELEEKKDQKTTLFSLILFSSFLYLFFQFFIFLKKPAQESNIKTVEEKEKKEKKKGEEKEKEKKKGKKKEEGKEKEEVDIYNKEDKKENKEGEKKEEKKEEEEVKSAEYPDGHVPWNAVCVVGLRVYSQDPEVTVTLAEIKDMEEGPSVVVDSYVVGPTMMFFPQLCFFFSR